MSSGKSRVRMSTTPCGGNGISHLHAPRRARAARRAGAHVFRVRRLARARRGPAGEVVRALRGGVRARGGERVLRALRGARLIHRLLELGAQRGRFGAEGLGEREAATKEAVASAACRASLVHLATHGCPDGLFLAGDADPTKPSLSTADVPKLVAALHEESSAEGASPPRRPPQRATRRGRGGAEAARRPCLLYTSDAADE